MGRKEGRKGCKKEKIERKGWKGFKKCRLGVRDGEERGRVGGDGEEEKRVV